MHFISETATLSKTTMCVWNSSPPPPPHKCYQIHNSFNTDWKLDEYVITLLANLM